MSQVASDILAIVAIALTLAGVNEGNPYPYPCLAAAAICAAISIKTHQGKS